MEPVVAGVSHGTVKAGGRGGGGGTTEQRQRWQQGGNSANRCSLSKCQALQQSDL